MFTRTSSALAALTLLAACGGGEKGTKVALEEAEAQADRAAAEDGRIACAVLPLIRLSTENRLAELVAAHRTAGAAILDDAAPLAMGAPERLSEAQRALKMQADPAGLINPPGPAKAAAPPV